MSTSPRGTALTTRPSCQPLLQLATRCGTRCELSRRWASAATPWWSGPWRQLRAAGLSPTAKAARRWFRPSTT
eukprot:165053-Alexandrium_andersonii.AAC.1